MATRSEGITRATMTQLNIKLFVILIGSILATGLQGMESQPQAQESANKPKAFFSKISEAFAPQLRNTIALAKKEVVKRDPYLDNAKALRDMVLDKRNRGELPSIGGAQHADVESIDMCVVNPKCFSLKISDLKKSFALLRYEKARQDNNELMLKWYSRAGLAELSNTIKEGRIGVHGRLMIDPKKSVIVFDSMNSTGEIDTHDVAVFHELAHALDACSKNGQDDLDCYHWLKDDVQHYDTERVTLKEWHADKQAIAWLKKYKPDQAKELIEYYDDSYKRRLEFLDAPHYAPLVVRLAWLRDPNV
jgi:hypothetical protein